MKEVLALFVLECDMKYIDYIYLVYRKRPILAVTHRLLTFNYDLIFVSNIPSNQEN